MLSRNILLIAGGGFIGLLIDQIFAALFLATLICLFWQLFHFYQLNRWLQHNIREKESPPQVRDPFWTGIYRTVSSLQQHERKRKRKMKRILQQFLDAISALPDAVILLDKNEQVEWCNQAAQNFLGLDPSRDIGLPIRTLIRQPSFIEFLSQWQKDESIIISSPLKSELQLKVRMLAFGKKRRLLLLTDVSEALRVERMRRDFVANASHELRTPLTVFTGYLEALLDNDIADSVDAHWHKPLLQMQEQSSRMLRIIEDLLFLSRLENESAPPEKPVAVAVMLKRLAEDAQMLSAEKQQLIQLEADSDLLIYGAEQELNSAFSNLIMNAVKHTSAGTQIDIRWYQDENGIYMSVEDNGGGIAPQHLSRLSERFYRVDRSRQNVNGSTSTGLGLAICKHVLQRHDGKLRIESQIGAGSLFSCDFPLSKQVISQKNQKDSAELPEETAA